MKKIIFVCVCVSGSYTNTTFDAVQLGQANLSAIQSTVNDLDSSALTPATKSNKRLLRGLHQVSLVLDGKSDMHSLIKKNRVFLDYLNTTIANSSLPGMQADLGSLKADLIDRQNQVRAAMSEHVKQFYTNTVQNGLLANFTNSIANATIDQIRNLSQNLREIEIFVNLPENQFGGISNSTVNLNLNTFYNYTVPREEANLAVLNNKIEYVYSQIRKLKNVDEPTAESIISTAILAQINAGMYNVSATLAAAQAADLAQFKLMVNQSADGLNAEFNSTKNHLLAQLGGSIENTLDAQIAAMSHFALLNDNNTAQLNTLKDSISGRIQLVRDGKGTILQSIRPLVAGLGNSSMSQQAESADLISTLATQLNDTKDTLNGLADQAAATGITNFTSGLNSMYGTDLNSTMDSVADLQAKVASIFALLNDTLMRRVNATGPTGDRMANLAEGSIQDTIAGIETAEDLITAETNLTRSKINSDFKNLFSNETEQVRTVRENARNSSEGYMQVVLNVSSNVDAQLAGLVALWQTSLNSLVSNGNDRVALFYNQTGPYPSVETQYNATLDDRESAVVALEANVTSLDAAVASLKAKQDAQIADLFTNLNNAFNFSANIDFDSNFTLAKSQIGSHLADTVATVLASPSFASNEINAVNELVHGQFDAVSSVIAGQIANSSFDYSQLKQTVDALMETIRDRKLNLDATAAQLATDYAQNVSIDNTQVNQFVQSEVSSLQSNWTNQIETQIESNNATNMINSLLADITPDLVYSDDNTQFVHATTNAQSDLDAIDAVLSGFTDTLRNQMAQTEGMSEPAMTAMQTQLNDLIAASTAKLSPDRVTQLHTEIGAALNASVDTEQAAIISKLQTEFLTTQNALSDYLNYLNATANATTVDTNAQQSSVASVALELHNHRQYAEKVLNDSALAVVEQREKNSAIQEILLKREKDILDNAKNFAENSNHLQVAEIQDSDFEQNLFYRNLSTLSRFVQDRLTNFSRSLADDTVTGNRTIGYQNRAQKIRLKTGVKNINNEIGDLVTNLNETQLFPLMHQVTDLQQSLKISAQNAHQQFVQFMTNQTAQDAFGVRIERDNKIKYSQLINRLAAMVQSVGMEIPQLVNTENSHREMLIKGESNKILEILEGHNFPAETEDVPDIDRVAQNIAQSRITLKEAAKAIHKPKDFSSNVNDIRNKIDSIQKELGKRKEA